MGSSKAKALLEQCKKVAVSKENSQQNNPQIEPSSAEGTHLQVKKKKKRIMFILYKCKSSIAL